MAYYCENCDNAEEFEVWAEFTEWGTEQLFIDGEGSIQDYGERETSDSESGEWGPVECSRCGEEAEELTDEEIMEIRNRGREPEEEVPRVTPDKRKNWKNIIEGNEKS